MSHASDAESQVRAARFPLRWPLRFRPSGSTAWYSGQTENISCSGALFRCRRPLQASASVDVVLPFPTEISGQVPLKMICKGHITRALETPDASGRMTVAVAFADVRLARRNEVSETNLTERRDLRHTVNNQLMVIQGTCDVLLATPDLPDNIREALLRIEEASDRIVGALRSL